MTSIRSVEVDIWSIKGDISIRMSTHHRVNGDDRRQVDRHYLCRDRFHQHPNSMGCEIRNPHPQHPQPRQLRQQTQNQLPRTIPQVQPPQPLPMSQKPPHTLIQPQLLVVPHQQEPKRLQMRQKRMPPLKHMVAPKHHARAAGLLKRPVQRQALQVVRVGDPREHEVRYPRIDEVEVREVLDGDGLEGAVPGVRAREVRAEDQVPERVLVLVEHRPHLAHVREPVVVFGAQGEFAEVAEFGDPDGVEVPAAVCG